MPFIGLIAFAQATLLCLVSLLWRIVVSCLALKAGYTTGRHPSAAGGWQKPPDQSAAAIARAKTGNQAFAADRRTPPQRHALPRRPIRDDHGSHQLG